MLWHVKGKVHSHLWWTVEKEDSRWILKNGHVGKGKESQVGKTGEAKLGSRNVYTY